MCGQDWETDEICEECDLRIDVGADADGDVFLVFYQPVEDVSMSPDNARELAKLIARSADIADGIVDPNDVETTEGN